eukprot:4551686-Prorocentrum_lima.AAC.1
MDSPLQCRCFRGRRRTGQFLLFFLRTAWPPLAIHAACIALRRCKAGQPVEPQCTRPHGALRAAGKEAHGHGRWGLCCAHMHECADVMEAEVGHGDHPSTMHRAGFLLAF